MQRVVELAGKPRHPQLAKTAWTLGANGGRNHLGSAASNALAGRLAEAQKAIVCVRQIDPTLRVSNRKDWVPFRRPEDLAISRVDAKRPAPLGRSNCAMLRHGVPALAIERRLTAILATDVAGYSRRPS
jgi:hypothetical protein